MLSAKNGKAYSAFYDAVRDESVLDKKTTILIGLAAAMTAGCAP
jgi:alkylhydroperoxidase/carboxymuconolactone decarboxylase family protein YurZ